MLCKNSEKNWQLRKSWNVGEFTKLVPETESQNSEDHELFWNHEMQGSPVP